MKLTEDQITALAPDEASRKSGKELANPSKWLTAGVNEAALWGECQGSGSKPYLTQIDIVNIAFKCSCPSRKFPCKHGLGLFLLYARQPDSFVQKDPPAWVIEWISKRADKQEDKPVKEEKPVNEAAQAKRQQARQQKVNDGIEELRLWLKDIVRNGILTMPEKGQNWFENMAKRMVDAQAPGLANMVRNLGETNFYEEGWQSVFMDRLLGIYLTIEGFVNSTAPDEKIHQDLRTLIGFTQSQEELKEQTGITDTWLILAKQSTETDNITTERTWLYGTGSEMYALVLQFIARGQTGQLTLTPGIYIQAELVFYPSASPLRAVIKAQAATNATSFNKFDGWKQVAETETSLTGTFPLRSERPYIIQQLKPVQYNKKWWLQDTSHNMMEIKNEQKTIWTLLSLSGGKACDIVVIGKEDQYEPVGIWYNDEYKIL